MSRYSTKQILDRIKGMYPAKAGHLPLIQKEPVLVVEGEKQYWAILDKCVLTIPEGVLDANDVLNRNGIIYFICGPISTEE